MGGGVGAFVPKNLLVIRVDDAAQLTFRDAFGDRPWAETPYNAAHTPKLSSYASQSIVFNNMYTAPVCGASRLEFLTGDLCIRAGQCSNSETTVPTTAVTLVDVVKASYPGLYHARHIGKWGTVGIDASYAALEAYGFDYHFGSLGNLISSYDASNLSLFTWEPVGGAIAHSASSGTYLPDLLLEKFKESIDYVEEQGTPWIIFLDLFLPHGETEPVISWAWHNPNEGAPWGYANCPQGTYEEYGCHLLMSERAIETVAMEAIAYLSAETADNTIVFISGDNGEEAWVGTDRPIRTGQGKTTLAESGINVGGILRYPGMHFSARGLTAEARIDTTDMMVTILDLMQADAQPVGYSPDGISVADFVRGACDVNDCNVAPKTHILKCMGTECAIIDQAGTWKFYYDTNDSSSHLYNLSLDPKEAIDLCAGDCSVTTTDNETTCQDLADEMQTIKLVAPFIDCAGLGGGPVLATVDPLDLNIPTERLPKWYNPAAAGEVKTKYDTAQGWSSYDVTCTTGLCGGGRTSYQALGGATAACPVVTTSTGSDIDCMIDNAPANTRLFVPNGTYAMTNTVTVGRDDIVIEGESQTGVKFNRTTPGRGVASGCGLDQAGAMHFSFCSEHRNTQASKLENWTAGYAYGEDTLTVDDTTDFPVGQWVSARMSNGDFAGQCEYFLEWPVGQPSTHRVMGYHMAKVTARSVPSGGGTVTLDRPLTFNWNGSGCKGFFIIPHEPLENVGLENVTLVTDASVPMCQEYGTGCNGATMIKYPAIGTENVVDSWFVGVTVERTYDKAVNFEYSARIWNQGGRLTEHGLNNVDLSTGYMHRSTTDIVHENIICDNSKVCFQTQQGAQSTVIAYSYFSNQNVEDDDLCLGLGGRPCTHEKSIFSHGFWNRHTLMEGNDLDGRITFYDAWWGKNGPYHTAYRNRNSRVDGTEYNHCGGANYGLLVFDKEAFTGVEQSSYGNIIGNTMLGYSPRASIDGNPDCTEINPPDPLGINSGMAYLWAEKNIFRLPYRRSLSTGTCSPREDWCAWQILDSTVGITGNDATTSCGTTDPSEPTCPGTNVNRLDPDPSMYRDDATAPDWWCQEACEWDHDGIGAFGDTFTSFDTGPTLCKLPAQIRFESGTCTPMP
jgi:arylsulfatase A-like enzyme